MTARITRRTPGFSGVPVEMGRSVATSSGLGDDADVRIAAPLFWAVVPLLVACSDSARAVPMTPLVVWVLDEGTEPGEEPGPLAGAAVAFDPPGGATGRRVERTTDASGHVIFEADFGQGGGHVSALTSEHTLVTMLDVSPASARARPNSYRKPVDDVVVVLPRLDRTFVGRGVDLRGAMTGKQDEAHLVSLTASTTRRLGRSLTNETRYALRAPRGRPFVLLGRETREDLEDGRVVALEHVKSFRLEVAPRTADGVLDIDVGAERALATRTIRIRGTLPDTLEPSSRLFAEVASLDSQVSLGETVVRAATGSVVAEAPVVLADTDLGGERLVTSATWVSFDGAVSRRSELGIATDGATLDGFLPPPVVAGASRRITDPIVVERLPPDADVRVEVFGGGQLFWILRGPPLRGGRLVLPPPFGLSFTTDVQVLALRIAAETDRIDIPPHQELYRRVAVSRDILVRR